MMMGHFCRACNRAGYDTPRLNAFISHLASAEMSIGVASEFSPAPSTSICSLFARRFLQW